MLPAPQMQMPRVLISVSAPALRAGLAALLAGAGCGLATDPASAEVLLVDDAWLSAGPTELPELALVALGDDPAWPATLRRLAPRGWAWLPEGATPPELRAAVLAAAAGLAALPADRADGLDTDLTDADAPARTTAPLDEPLTPREAQVLDWLAQGLSNKGIALRLGVSENTVKFHVQAVFGKLGVGSRAGATMRAAQLGLIVV